MNNRREFLASAAALSGFASVLGSVPLSAADASATATPSGKPIPLAPPDKQPPKLTLPTPAERKAGWAIVGLGELALNEIMPAFAEAKLSQPVALVSGHPDKAKRVAEAYGIDPKAIYGYKNYDDIAADKRVDIIYIVLPNSMHAEYSIRGLRAGKHVLCEKPMSVTVEEAERMIAAGKEAQRLLGIGYRLHSEPLNRHVMELCTRLEFGRVKTFESSNCQDVKAPNIRLSAELGGGPVGDVGVYSINAARYVTGEEPVEVTATACQPTDDPRFREVPESVAFTLRFPSGALAHCDCSFGTAESRRYRVHCGGGWIEMDPAFSYRGLRLRTAHGDAKTGTLQTAEHMLEQVNHFAAEMDHFSECVLQGASLRTPGEMGLADMRVIAAIAEAARSGKTVKI